MMQPEPERGAPRRRAAPMLSDEAEGRAALVQAPILEPAELEQAGDRQDGRPRDPAILQQPVDTLDGGMQRGVEQMGGDAEGGQTSRYPATSRAISSDRSDRPASSRSNRRSSGKTVGSIMAEIISSQPPT